MKIYVDLPRANTMRNDTKSLSFNVVQFSPDFGHQVITGFRLMDGFIHPPASFWKKTRKYYPSFYTSKEVAMQIYQAVIAANWVKTYDLPELYSQSKAIIPLVLTTSTASKVFPSIVDDSDIEADPVFEVPSKVAQTV